MVMVTVPALALIIIMMLLIVIGKTLVKRGKEDEKGGEDKRHGMCDLRYELQVTSYGLWEKAISPIMKGWQRTVPSFSTVSSRALPSRR
jgi:hypothetical protein